MRRAYLPVVLIALFTVHVFAQASVRVTRDQAVIWQPGFGTMAAVVKAGTVLEVVARNGEWYEVVLPPPEGATGKTGMIAVNQVTLVSGSVSAPAPAGSRASQTEPPREPGRAGVRGFGNIGYERFNAHNSFNAVLGQPGGFWYGGGGEFHPNDRLYFQASVNRFRRTGERVFVNNGQVFKLGIPDTVTITPFDVTVGYRFRTNSSTVPYVGGGVGRYNYKEESKFADASENPDEHFTSYHVVGGVEWRGTSLIGTAFELQYTHVPNFEGGVSDSFKEHNLGGLEVRVKILVGR